MQHKFSWYKICPASQIEGIEEKTYKDLIRRSLWLGGLDRNVAAGYKMKPCPKHIYMAALTLL